LAKNIK